MDDITLLLIVACVCITLGYIVRSIIESTQLVRLEAGRAQARISAAKSAARGQRSQAPPEEQLAPWVGELMGVVGLTPSALFSEELAEPVSQFMPLIKGYLATNPDIIKKVLSGDGDAGQMTLSASGYI